MKNIKPEIGINKKDLDLSTHLLSAILADEMVLYIKTRKFHWNVSGNSFMELHELFEEQYNQLEETVDAVAERISKLGGKTIGTMNEFITNSRLKESPDQYPEQKEMIEQLLEDHETVIKELRKDILKSSESSSDAGTVDFLTAILEEHETNAWILRRYLN